MRAGAVAAVRESDRRLLRLLTAVPVAATRQIPPLVDPDAAPGVVVRHLYRLADRGLLARIRIPARAAEGAAARGAALWYLPAAGRQVAAAVWGTDPDAPSPLPPMTTPHGAALAWAAAAVTEWLVQCQALGLTVGLEAPGAELGWPGWPAGGSRPALDLPPLVLARVKGCAETLAVDFVRPGGTIPQARLRRYQELLAARGGAVRVAAVLAVGWSAPMRQPVAGIVVCTPAAGAEWVRECTRRGD